MNNYDAIQQHIQHAKLERSIYVAELVADVVNTTWNGIKYCADVLLSVARARNPKGIFTFDA